MEAIPRYIILQASNGFRARHGSRILPNTRRSEVGTYHGTEEIPNLCLALAKLRRVARWHGHLPIQGQHPILTLLHKVCLRQYAVQPNALFAVPDGGGFADMVNLRGNIEVDNKINKIIRKFAEANELKEVLLYLALFQDISPPQETDNS